MEVVFPIPYICPIVHGCLLGCLRPEYHPTLVVRSKRVLEHIPTIKMPPLQCFYIQPFVDAS